LNPPVNTFNLEDASEVTHECDLPNFTAAINQLSKESILNWRRNTAQQFTDSKAKMLL
jgi:hypothetical protein